MLTLPAMTLPSMLMFILVTVPYTVAFWGAAIAGIAGAFTATTTRDDAFPAADRQPKWIWVGLLSVASILCWAGSTFLAVVGAVIICIYWCDVRPQIRLLIG